MIYLQSTHTHNYENNFYLYQELTPLTVKKRSQQYNNKGNDPDKHFFLQISWFVTNTLTEITNISRTT